MALISSPSQNADRSIFDLNGRQIYLGNGFSAGTVTQPVVGTTETPWLTLQNPLTSGQSVFCYNRNHAIITTSSQIATFRYYVNPTITANGTSIIPVNNRINVNSPTSNILVFQGPTTTSFGTELTGTATTTATGSPTIINTLIIIDPGFTILVTVTTGSAPNPVSYQVLWYEIPYI